MRDSGIVDTARPSDRREVWWRRPWTALGLLFLVSLPAVTPRLYASDEIQYFAYLRSLWFDRDLSFDNEYRYFYNRGIARAHGFRETFLEMETAAGRRLNFGTIGCAILWAPFYAVADVAVRVQRAAGRPVAADGYSRPYLAAVAFGSAVYGFLALVVSGLVARRLVGAETASALAALVVWVGTPLVFYMYVAPGMAHACSAFVVAVFVWTWLRVRAHWSARGIVALGALAALMAMVREQDVFFAAGPAADFAVTLLGRTARDVRAAARLAARALAGALAFAAAFLPQALAYLVLNGRLGPSPFVEAKMDWTAPWALAVLLSPHHGLFVWTPIAVLALLGLVWLVLGHGADEPGLGVERPVAWALLVMFASQVYVSGSVSTWTAAGAFGQRRFVGTTVLLVVGLAALMRMVEGRRVARRAAAFAMGVGVWWNLGLMAQFGAGLMDRQRLEPARNAYTTFVVIPRRLPELAYRYLFDRASFYQAPERYR